MQEFEGAGLLAGLLVSGTGFVLFSYGKKMSRVPHLVCGVTLFVGPYFIESGLATLVFGLAAVLLLYASVRLGW